jgi:NADH-quinone oxidoreductase subunit L
VFGFILSLLYITVNGWHAAQELSTTWLAVGDLKVEFALRLDALSMLTMLLVTGVASAIHIYSWGYMSEDPGFSRFFASLSFFTFSMLGIVLANNFIELFIFWELVGVSSYLLIGFWFERPAAADAGKKAFLTTRLGDGFLLGILMVWDSGITQFQVLEAKLRAPDALGPMTTMAGLLIFVERQGERTIPLHVVADAMEGPTPVSALILRPWWRQAFICFAGYFSCWTARR